MICSRGVSAGNIHTYLVAFSLSIVLTSGMKYIFVVVQYIELRIFELLSLFFFFRLRGNLILWFMDCSWLSKYSNYRWRVWSSVFFYADGQGYVYLSGTLRKRLLLVFLFIVFVLKMNGPLQCSLFGFPIKVNSWQKYSCQDHISEGLLFRWISRSSENVNMNSFQNIFHLFSRSREVLNSLFVVLLFVL